MLVLFVLLAVALGRYELVREQVVSTARAAANAAAVATTSAQAEHDALAAATVSLQSTRACVQPAVTVDSHLFTPGGSVRVVVTCRVSYSGLAVPGFPGGFNVVATETTPIDPFRSVAP